MLQVWILQASLATSDQTLLLVLIFVFAVLALLALGARSFIQLVDLILSRGSSVVQPMQDNLLALMRSLLDKGVSISSVQTGVTPTTQDNPSGSSIVTTSATTSASPSSESSSNASTPSPPPSSITTP